MNNLTQEFLTHLEASGISKSSIKYYKSDTRHFSGWLILKCKSLGSSPRNLSEAVVYITKNTAEDYKEFMVKNSASIKTINRRLSTLRRLSSFLLETNLVNFDFAGSVGNIRKGQKGSKSKMSVNFERYLTSQEVSQNTVKNYLSDINQFISWLDKQPA